MSLPPGATIGILGGGQLGRMLAGAAAKLGFDVAVYCPDPRAPAGRVAARHWQKAYDDTHALAAFAAACDAVTVEFENVPVAAADLVEAAGVPMRPGPRALAIAQDRAEEKTFLESIGIACAPWRPVSSLDELRAAQRAIGPDTILKTRREGYDGKGQVRLSDRADLPAAWQAIGQVPAVLEGVVDFSLEVSALVARGVDGETACWDPPHNTHEGGILRRSIVPAPIEDTVRAGACEAGRTLAAALDYVGVLALELFVLEDGSLIANEIAPRVHNSGHWTPEASATCQFENHIRAVAGWPLGPVTRFHDAQMVNLIGEEALAGPALMQDGASVTLYGKREARPGRKMGHLVRRLGPAGG